MKIAAVTCARDEAEVIEEWIAHHLALGIERIHIFDNMSRDTTRSKIEAIARQVPGVTVQTLDYSGFQPQNVAFAAGLEIMRAENIDWCAFLDVDEFIGNGHAGGGEPEANESFAAFLGRHDKHYAIGLHWAVFGSSGHVSQPPGLMQEAFLRRGEDSFDVHRHIKSLVRPHFATGVHHSHGLALPFPYVNARGEEIVWRTEAYGSPVVSFAYTENAPSLEGWRLNHYFCRWRGRWEEKLRLARLQDAAGRTEQDWVHHDRNEILDQSALSWTGKDRAMLERLGVDTTSTGEAV